MYSAQWDGFRLVKYSPNGEKISEIKFPIAKISSLAFGGTNLNKIIITSANRPWVEDDFQNINSGQTFIMNADCAGVKEPLVDF